MAQMRGGTYQHLPTILVLAHYIPIIPIYIDLHIVLPSKLQELQNSGCIFLESPRSKRSKRSRFRTRSLREIWSLPKSGSAKICHRGNQLSGLDRCYGCMVWFGLVWDSIYILYYNIYIYNTHYIDSSFFLFFSSSSS